MAVPRSQNPEGFWQEKGYSFPMVHDQNGGEHFGVGPIPHTIFLDAEGNIIDQQVGMMEPAEFEAMLSKLLK